MFVLYCDNHKNKHIIVKKLKKKKEPSDFRERQSFLTKRILDFGDI